MGWRAALLGFVLCLASGCQSYEYEEEVFLEVDGSGRLRVSGSSAMLASLHGIEDPSLPSVSGYFEGEEFDVTSVRETERAGRRFFHVEADFTNWNAVCRHPAFSRRPCRLVLDDEAGERRLELSAPPPETDDGPPPGLDGVASERIAIRFHFPSSVLEHNAPNGIERGNILSWEREVREHFGAAPLDVRVRFGARSVLSTTIRILALSGGTVLLVVVASLGLMVRQGRRQLRDEAETKRRQGATATTSANPTP